MLHTVRALNRSIVCSVLALVLLAGAFFVDIQSAQAACAALDTSRGQVTMTVNVPTAATYRIWSRIMAPDTTNNSYTLEIDSTTCNVNVGDSASIPANTWTWVDYQGGTSTSHIDVSLTAGNHTVTLTGREDNVSVDRLIFTTDLTCIPTGTGDNCATPPDTTAPVVSISSPADNSTLASNGTLNVAATATDNSGTVSKVEFYIDNNGTGTPVATDTTSPFSYSAAASTLSVGAHTIVAKAYDPSNNTTTSAVTHITVTDAAAPTVSLTAPTNGATVSGTIVMSATANDNVGVTKVEFYVDGTLKATDTTSPYSQSLDTTALANGARSITAKAYDAANNSTSSSAASVTVNNVTQVVDTVAPTAGINSPAASAVINGSYPYTAFTVSVLAADNVGVTRVDLYLDNSNTVTASDTTAPFDLSVPVTASFAKGSHTFKVIARDAAGNASVASTVTASYYMGADLNTDGGVGPTDFSMFLKAFGKTGANAGRADLNGSGLVDPTDFSMFLKQYGR